MGGKASSFFFTRFFRVGSTEMRKKDMPPFPQYLSTTSCLFSKFESFGFSVTCGESGGCNVDISIPDIFHGFFSRKKNPFLCLLVSFETKEQGRSDLRFFPTFSREIIPQIFLKSPIYPCFSRGYVGKRRRKGFFKKFIAAAHTHMCFLLFLKKDFLLFRSSIYERN